MKEIQKYKPVTQGQTLFLNLNSRYIKILQDLKVKEAAVLNLRLERLGLHDEMLDALRNFIKGGDVVYLKDGEGNVESVVIAQNKLYDAVNCKWLIQVRSKLGSLRMEYVDDLYLKTEDSLSDEEIILNETISAITERIANWPKEKQEAFLRRLDGWKELVLLPPNRIYDKPEVMRIPPYIKPNHFACGSDRGGQHTTSKHTGRGN